MKEHTKSTQSNTNRAYPDNARTGKGTATGRSNSFLQRLNDLDDYKVASDDPDVRGWSVISGDNEKIGTVDELIVDTQRMKVRYLVVDVKDGLGFEKNENHLLVPIGAARLHDKNNDVIVSGLTSTNLKGYPAFRGSAITRDYENSVRRFYEAGGTVPAASSAESITTHETIRDAHTGKTYERQDREGVSGVDSNSRNRVDVVTGTSATTGNDHAFGTGKISNTPLENRMGDHAQEESNTISQGHSAESRRPEGSTPIGQFNLNTSGDVKDRIQTRGISSSRTSNLPNKELRQGPASDYADSDTDRTDHVNPKNISESERVRIHDTDPNIADRDRREESGDTGFNSTSNLNRSTSLGNDTKRGSNMGNQENKANNPGINDRSRMSSPEFTDRTSTPGASRHPDKYPEGTRPVNQRDLEHSSDELPDDRYDPDTDEFYTHTHFDEEKFYENRRRRDRDDV